MRAKFLFLFIITASPVAFGFSLQRIMGGTFEKDGSDVARRTVALVQKSKSRAFCSGSLVAPRLVLTAAHCVADYKDADMADLHVAFGTDAVGGDARTIPVERAAIHPDYDGGADSIYELCPFGRCPENFLELGSKNDFAVLLLKTEAPDDFTAVELNTSDAEEPGQTLIAGYGRREERDSNIKLLGRLKSHTADTHFMPKILKYLADSTAESGACHGDSGGPMFARREGRLVQVGVASHLIFGSEGACGAKAVAYTSVVSVTEWIRRQATSIESQKEILRRPVWPEGFFQAGPSLPDWMRFHVKSLRQVCESASARTELSLELQMRGNDMLARGQVAITRKGRTTVIRPVDGQTRDGAVIVFHVDALKAEEAWERTRSFPLTFRDSAEEGEHGLIVQDRTLSFESGAAGGYSAVETTAEKIVLAGKAAWISVDNEVTGKTVFQEAADCRLEIGF